MPQPFLRARAVARSAIDQRRHRPIDHSYARIWAKKGRLPNPRTEESRRRFSNRPIFKPTVLLTLVDDRHAAAVLRPGGLGRADHCRTLLAVADPRDTLGRDAQGDEDVLHRIRTALAERQIVLARAALVAM